MALQAEVGRHRMAIKESGKGSGTRPHIKGRFGAYAGRLRDWLGEYLIAKYEELLQTDLANEFSFRHR